MELPSASMFWLATTAGIDVQGISQDDLTQAQSRLDSIGRLDDRALTESPLNQLVFQLAAATKFGDKAVGRRLLAALEEAGNTFAGFSISARRLCGIEAAILGERDRSRAHFEGAIEDCAAFRCRPELALSRFHLAELLLDHYPDEHDAAIEHLDLAVTEFQDMKMQPALERALGRRGLLKA